MYGALFAAAADNIILLYLGLLVLVQVNSSVLLNLTD